MRNYNAIFYTVAGLTVLTVISVLVSNLFPDYIGNENFRTWGLGAVLAEIIGLFVLLTKNSISSKHINIFLTLPEEIQGTDLNIVWDSENCFIVSENLKEKIRMMRSGIGPGYKVYLNQKLMNKIVNIEIIEFQLQEENGREWRVSPFNLYDCTKKLEINELSQLQLNYD